ncbi:aminotransferase 2 [Pycnococcus provasolii]|uniref:alanine--glyoxylate transaminase n=1 Tax=Pycnococcus provasolii TaxID=41880 RepID=A0A830HM97_9CHLO|nr:aminotransferase 2 [Pycnococcus provasolii]|eukprot:CAMPEP_0205962410 /NCGR_PEP_ID=MMETSP1459-20131121/70583_1 /ASSEMBLY_ACC=CAM_ASM_001120 /TAXON_ID=41880 /ORGANISM="Pycnococcus provasolii, Strain RCC931" /LENGTH=536 /DNA_ID=CAMNT_0053335187 /DNA_START=1092 /DNA_END=2702 /DNA_ORIENTATION=-
MFASSSCALLRRITQASCGAASYSYSLNQATLTTGSTASRALCASSWGTNTTTTTTMTTTRHFSSASSSSSSSSAGAAGAAGAAGELAQWEYAEPPTLPPHDYKPPPYDGPPKEEVIAMRQQFLNPAIFHFYKQPVLITNGHMQYLYDEKGRRFLDAFAGIVTVSVGHSHPAVMKAAADQLTKLQHTTTIYFNEQTSLYAKEFVERMPKNSNLSRVYFVNSGSEANDLAMLMARLYTGNNNVVALSNGYHGTSVGTMGLTALHTWKYPVAHGEGIVHAPCPMSFRGTHGDDVDAYVRDLNNVIMTQTSGRIAGFFHETIQGVGGGVPLLDGYLPKAYEAVRAAGGVCIADEVQTGFGRTGTAYWGFENQGVTPDIVTMAKGIGNGFPLAAVVTTPEIAQTLAQRLHFNTYGAQPVVSAVGRAVLKAIDDDGLQENSLRVGARLMQRLKTLQDKHDLIGEVRGKGLMMALELVTDRATKVPAKEETTVIFERLKELGVLIGKGGLHGNVFRIKPPMCFSEADADFLCDALDLALSEL